MHEALIMPSRGVAISIHPYEIGIRQLMSLGIDKMTTSHFLLKAIAIFGHCKIIYENYALANGLTPASAHNTSLILHFLHKIINTNTIV